VPPYFALILRCFSVIEGIALRVDPQYAIVSECFPYLCRRLLTDDHPRAKRALRELLFGNGRHVDLARLERMAEGFGNYTVAGLTDVPHRRPPGAVPSREQDLEVALSGAAGGRVVDVAGDTRPLLSPAAKEALLVLFSPRGNYAQELLVGQAVATVDAASRQLAATTVGSLLGSAPALAGLSAIESLGPWRSLLLPLPTPLELLNRWGEQAGRGALGPQCTTVLVG
jgi:aarF domain-containing kinase